MTQGSTDEVVVDPFSFQKFKARTTAPGSQRRKYFLISIITCLISTISANPINRQAGISENVYITVQNDTYGIEQRVCSIEFSTYEDGESIPTSSPCEHCICRPPGFACTIISCEYRQGCKALKRSDQCCPEYQCECEKHGQVFQNGEKILDDNNPCEVCYCQGGEVICAIIDCFWRSDCQPRYIENRCCPLYDHCPSPSEHGPLRPTQRPTTTSTSTTTLSTPISWFNMSSAIYATPSTSRKPPSYSTETNPVTVPSLFESHDIRPDDKSQPPLSSNEVNQIVLPEEVPQNNVSLPVSSTVSTPPETSESVSQEPVNPDTPQTVNIVAAEKVPQEILKEKPISTESDPASEVLQTTTQASNLSQSTFIQIVDKPENMVEESPQGAQIPQVSGVPLLISPEVIDIVSQVPHTEAPLEESVSQIHELDIPEMPSQDITPPLIPSDAGPSIPTDEMVPPSSTSIQQEVKNEGVLIPEQNVVPPILPFDTLETNEWESTQIPGDEKVTTPQSGIIPSTMASTLTEDLTPELLETEVLDSIPLVVDEQPPVISKLTSQELEETNNGPSVAELPIQEIQILNQENSVISQQNVTSDAPLIPTVETVKLPPESPTVGSESEENNNVNELVVVEDTPVEDVESSKPTSLLVAGQNQSIEDIPVGIDSTESSPDVSVITSASLETLTPVSAIQDISSDSSNSTPDSITVVTSSTTQFLPNSSSSTTSEIIVTDDIDLKNNIYADTPKETTTIINDEVDSTVAPMDTSAEHQAVTLPAPIPEGISTNENFRQPTHENASGESQASAINTESNVDTLQGSNTNSEQLVEDLKDESDGQPLVTQTIESETVPEDTPSPTNIPNIDVILNKLTDEVVEGILATDETTPIPLSNNDATLLPVLIEEVKEEIELAPMSKPSQHLELPIYDFGETLSLASEVEPMVIDEINVALVPPKDISTPIETMSQIKSEKNSEESSIENGMSQGLVDASPQKIQYDQKVPVILVDLETGLTERPETFDDVENISVPEITIPIVENIDLSFPKNVETSTILVKGTSDEEKIPIDTSVEVVSPEITTTKIDAEVLPSEGVKTDDEVFPLSGSEVVSSPEGTQDLEQHDSIQIHDSNEEILGTEAPDTTTSPQASTSPVNVQSTPLNAESSAPIDSHHEEGVNISDDKRNDENLNYETTVSPVTSELLNSFTVEENVEATDTEIKNSTLLKNVTLLGESSEQSDQNPIPNDHEFQQSSLPTTTVKTYVTHFEDVDYQHTEKESSKDFVPLVSVSENHNEGVISIETTPTPTEEKYRLDLSIFSDDNEDTKSETEIPEFEVAATTTENGVVYEIINADSHLPNSISESGNDPSPIITEVIQVPFNDDPSPTITEVIQVPFNDDPSPTVTEVSQVPFNDDPSPTITEVIQFPFNDDHDVILNEKEDIFDEERSTLPSSFQRHHHFDHEDNTTEMIPSNDEETMTSSPSDPPSLSNLPQQDTLDLISEPDLQSEANFQKLESHNPRSKSQIPVELIQRVNPISDDIENENSRSDLGSVAENEVFNADSTWYWRTLDRIRSLFPPAPLKSSRKPRSISNGNLKDVSPEIKYWGFPRLLLW